MKSWLRGAILAGLVVASGVAKGENAMSGPAATPRDEAVTTALARALEAKGKSYQARTRHKSPDGRPRFTNRLILQSSPYLLQHAHNPVDWWGWGDDAFAEARRRGVPVLLSVGYSTCHWCHVMEEESFEDEEIARYMNENYVAIKVDREERPDVDGIYMAAVQAMTGQGGWPMTVWLTPDKRPIYGGTYFPPRDGDRGAQAGFLTLLRRLSEAYRTQPDRIADSAAQLTEAIRERLESRGSQGDLPDERVLASALKFYERRYDAKSGGIAGSPKFPSSLPMGFLLRQGKGEAHDMAAFTLTMMARGGMYDQVAGGFHRYSTDATWLVPHFEKMLYDNALLAVAYTEGYLATGDAEHARVAREILRYVERDMTSPEVGFYSATDADSIGPRGEREEGYYFSWTPAELVSVLGVAEAQLVSTYFGVREGGNFEGRSLLHVPLAPHDVAKSVGLEPDVLRARIDAAREKLYVARGSRPAPLRDEKILASWNGLMISGYAVGALYLQDQGDGGTYTRIAERAADFVLTKLRRDGRLLRSYKDGVASHKAYLDDYAFVIAGLIDLYEATGAVRWLQEAIALDAVLAKHYEDSSGGGFFMTADDAELLLAREKPGYDGAEPSGNSVAVLNLLRLYELTTSESYRKRADAALRAFHKVLDQSPAALSVMLPAVQFRLQGAKEIVIVAPNHRREAEPFLEQLRSRFVPRRVLAVVVAGSHQAEVAKVVPLCEGKIAQRGQATAYVCENRVCDLPTTDPAVFAKQVMAEAKKKR